MKFYYLLELSFSPLPNNIWESNNLCLSIKRKHFQPLF
jgi:hypothetical protein